MIKIPLFEFFNEQKKLNDKIYECRKVNYSSIRNECNLALMVELMELCNTTRCFNYWSQKTRKDDDTILEEFADVLCFSLSVYLQYGLNEQTIIVIDDVKIASKHELVLQFIKLINLYMDIENEKGIHTFLIEFFKLGYMLGYDLVQILDAYKKKCKKNHNIQDEWQKN